MPFNGSGSYTPPGADFPAVPNTLIESSKFNAIINDIASGLSTCITKDGQQTVIANIPMGGYRFTGLGAGAANGQSLRYEQLFSTSAVTLLGAMNWVKGADIASAATINLTSATGNGVHVTGTTQIDAVTLGSGMWRLVIFDGILTLTHHATDNNLPGGANITTAAGDRAVYWSDGTTVYCQSYVRATGAPAGAATAGAVTTSGLTMATGRMLGRTTASTGAIEEITVGTGLSLSAGALTCTVTQPSAASQAEQETGSSTSVYVTPGRQQFHASAAKGWAVFNANAGINASYNVTSITDTGTGQAVVNWTTAFSSSNHCDQCTVTSSSNIYGLVESTGSGTTAVACRNTASGSLSDPTAYQVTAYGDQ